MTDSTQHTDEQTPPAAASADPAEHPAADEQAIETPLQELAPDAATEEPVAPPADEAALLKQLEAVLMSIERPIPPAKLAEVLGVAARDVNHGVKKLNKSYETAERSFRIETLAGGLQILTLPEFKDVVARLHRTKDDNKLSPAALETLAIVAYKQPIMRADIEAIRGVATGEVVRALMERHLVKIVGRAEEIGRPMLYGTTRTFLQVFGLASLKDLPKAEELAKP